jgi:Domain of unknown function (DUF4365)
MPGGARGLSLDGEPVVTPPRTGRMGVSVASLVFEAWGWLFREQPIEDYGIDAHVEPLDGPERPSRQLLALQIKTGASFFREARLDGWWFPGTRRHWHYWLGHMHRRRHSLGICASPGGCRTRSAAWRVGSFLFRQAALDVTTPNQLFSLAC